MTPREGLDRPAAKLRWPATARRFRSRGMTVPTVTGSSSSNGASNGVSEEHEDQDKPKTRRWPWLAFRSS